MDTRDLVVVGGGILGAACAREAALDGRSVLLVEAGDLAGFTSSASSKLVHGGLRYLEHRAFRLVREAVLERADLLTTANHLVEPLDFVLPVVPESRHGRLATMCALSLYDALAWPRGIGRHRSLAAGELRARLPGFRRHDAPRGGFLYRDARMDDARLCLEVLFDARDLGVEIRPRTPLVALRRVESVEPGHEVCWEAVFQLADGSREVVRAGSVLLCTGAKTDALLGHLGLATDEPLVSPSRGDHLVYPDWGLPQAAILPEPGSDRFFFAIPWQGMVVVGTTEDPWTPREGDPLPHAAERIRGWMRRYFPAVDDRPHAAFSGVRPLAHAPGKALHEASREHRLVEVAPRCHALVGGKYTTFRAIAASCRRVWDASGASRSAGRLLPGAWRGESDRAEAEALVGSWRLGEGASARMRRYGRGVADLEASLVDCRKAGIPPGLAGAATEIVHAVRREWAGDLVDVAARRTLDALRPDRGASLAPALHAVCASGLLPWDAEEQIEGLARWCADRTGGTR